MRSRRVGLLLRRCHGHHARPADTAPGVPTAVTAMETSDTEITVTWGSPASDGGADITGYMVQSAYMGADNMKSEWMDVDPAHMGMDMMYMVTRRSMAETTYSHGVLARLNSVGMGEYCDGGRDVHHARPRTRVPGLPTAVTAMETMRHAEIHGDVGLPRQRWRSRHHRLHGAERRHGRRQHGSPSGWTSTHHTWASRHDVHRPPV